MFSLHETTQRTLCRVLFVACCALPASAALLWCAYESTPWAAARWEASVAAPIGGVVEAEGFQRVRPGVLRLDRLRWMPEGAANAVELEAVQISSGGLSARNAAIEGGTIRQALLLLGRNTTPGRPMRIRVASLQVRGESSAETLRDVEVNADSGAAGWRVSAAGRCDKQPVRITAAEAGDAVRLTCDCRQGPVPAWVLGSLVDRFAGLSDARFAGRLSVEHRGGATSGEVVGAFADFPLHALLGKGSPHQWQGEGDLILERVAWADDRLLEAAGAVEAGPGAAGASLLAAANRSLRCGLRVQPAGGGVAFDRTAFRFRIDAQGIALSGQCPEFPGALLARGGAAVLTQPPLERLPIAHLVQTLTAEGGGWVPATRHAQQLARGLPLPQPEAPQERAPSVRTATRPEQPSLREPATIR
ncbi:MAG: hypothetical protein AAGA92_07195 [Planctomycetota bacterium]